MDMQVTEQRKSIKDLTQGEQVSILSWSIFQTERAYTESIRSFIDQGGTAPDAVPQENPVITWLYSVATEVLDQTERIPLSTLLRLYNEQTQNTLSYPSFKKALMPSLRDKLHLARKHKAIYYYDQHGKRQKVASSLCGFRLAS